jgi:segregation and condensation protein A
MFIERQKLSKPLNTKITRKELSVDDKIKDIRNILSIRKRVNFIELFTEVTKENIVVTFLSILEMTKSNEIILTQEDNFSPIMIERA